MKTSEKWIESVWRMDKNLNEPESIIAEIQGQI